MRRIAYHACAIAVSASILPVGGARHPELAVAVMQQPLNRNAFESCGAARDLLVQALEELGPNSTSEELGDALQLLKRASDLCSESGDAWYYRSLVETKLQHASKAQFALGQARTFGSSALLDAANPFVLATPVARGVIRIAKPPAESEAPSVLARLPQKWALVIGISQFRDESIRRLQYTTRDADGFAAALTDPAIGGFAPDHVRELSDAQATGKNIKQEMNWIARQAHPDDLVVLYVATHGSPRSVDSVGGVNYLVTYDTEMFKEGKLDEDAMYATAFPMVELANAVATRMKALRTLVVLDTCYSGGSFATPETAVQLAAKNAGPTQQMLERMGAGTGRIVMAASRSDEESLESAALGHGYFTYYLLEALKRDGGSHGLAKIFDGVAEKVAEHAAESGAQQHPVLYRSSPDADFSLQTTTTASAVGQTSGSIIR